jgi:hypothetical protein
MAYIGKTPTIGNFQICDAITVVDAQAAYTMQVGGVNVSPESANHMLVSLNGILQAPTSSFTVSGSTITFASALETGDVIDFIQILGNVLDLGVPSDNTVSLAKLTATGTKDATTFLRGDNTFDTPPLGGIIMADQWRLTATLNSNATPISSNLERIDTTGQGTIGTAMSVSSGIFTFPSTGIYLVRFNFMGESTADGFNTSIELTTNNSTYVEITQTSAGDSSGYNVSGTQETFIDVTDTSNVKVRFKATSMAGNSNTQIYGSTSLNYTTFTFIRLGDT